MAKEKTEKSSSGAGKFFLGAALGAIAGAVAGKFIHDKVKEAEKECAPDGECECGPDCDCDDCKCEKEPKVADKKEEKVEKAEKKKKA